MAAKGYPAQQLDAVDKVFTGSVVESSMVLGKNGKPKTVAELRTRINDYFEMCSFDRLRPGFESLSASLGVHRSTFWKWTRNQGCSKEWAEECQRAQSVIYSFLEQALLFGKINPASGIFLAKNWLNYKDSISIEESIGDIIERRLTPQEIAAKHNIQIGGLAEEMPVPTFLNREV